MNVNFMKDVKPSSGTSTFHKYSKSDDESGVNKMNDSSLCQCCTEVVRREGSNRQRPGVTREGPNVRIINLNQKIDTKYTESMQLSVA